MTSIKDFLTLVDSLCPQTWNHTYYDSLPSRWESASQEWLLTLLGQSCMPIREFVNVVYRVCIPTTFDHYLCPSDCVKLRAVDNAVASWRGFSTPTEEMHRRLMDLSQALDSPAKTGDAASRTPGAALSPLVAALGSLPSYSIFDEGIAYFPERYLSWSPRGAFAASLYLAARSTADVWYEGHLAEGGSAKRKPVAPDVRSLVTYEQAKIWVKDAARYRDVLGDCQSLTYILPQEDATSVETVKDTITGKFYAITSPAMSDPKIETWLARTVRYMHEGNRDAINIQRRDALDWHLSQGLSHVLKGALSDVLIGPDEPVMHACRIWRDTEE